MTPPITYHLRDDELPRTQIPKRPAVPAAVPTDPEAATEVTWESLGMHLWDGDWGSEAACYDDDCRAIRVGETTLHAHPVTPGCWAIYVDHDGADDPAHGIDGLSQAAALAACRDLLNDPEGCVAGAAYAAEEAER